MPPRKSVKLSSQRVLRRSLFGGALLGPLEMDIMTILWQRGEATTQDVKSRLPRSAAYTTILTTLKRLHSKGLLEQKRSANHLINYSPKCSRQEWELLAAKMAAERFLATPNISREALMSALQEAVRRRTSD